MQDRMEESRRGKQYSSDELERIGIREQELLSLRKQIQNQEYQFDKHRSNLKSLNSDHKFNNTKKTGYFYEKI